MTTYYLNGNPITEGSDITLNGMTYPYSWLEGTSPELRASYGMHKSGDTNFDTKYYWAVGIPKLLDDREEVDEDGNPLFVKISTIVDGESVMVDSDIRAVTRGLRTNCTEEIKIIVNNLLKPTDYLIIRNHVESVEIPSNVVTYRAAVIAEQDRATTALQTVTTVEELIEVMSSISWPAAE